MRGGTRRGAALIMAQMVLYLLFFPVLTLVLLRCIGGRHRGSGIRSHQNQRLPPSPPGLPIIGHLHLMGPHPHLSLRDIVDKHGKDGFMLLHLGQVSNLIVSSPSAAEAILRVHDHTFASRPPSAVANIIFSGSSDVALAPYGDYWRQVRRLVTTHVLSTSKVHSFRHAREEEVRLVVNRLQDTVAMDAVVDMSELLTTFANDVVCRAVSGKFFQVEGRNRVFKELIVIQVALFGGFNLDDCFPCLAKVGVLARMVCARARSLKKRWDQLLDEIIKEHASKLLSVQDECHDKSDTCQSQEDDIDFITVLLSLQQEYSLTGAQVKAILVDMFGAGTDTSSILLEYAMIELIKNPRIMAKVQDEITKNTPKGQEMVMEGNIINMTYLKAVMKETLRLHPPTPLLLPHFCMESCDVNGYTIPAATRVIVNAWALGRDARSWEKAEEFMPERFLDGGNNIATDFRGRDFMFVPFGAGRRMCPGMNFGMAVVEIMLANLLYRFHWDLPAGMTKEVIDMTVLYGLTIRRKEKLLLVPKLYM